MKQTSLRLPVLTHPRLTAGVVNVIDTILLWHERRYQRHLLAAMSDTMLRDIGLESRDVFEETAKPFWRA
mgnify:CR=1 FL=1